MSRTGGKNPSDNIAEEVVAPYRVMVVLDPDLVGEGVHILHRKLNGIRVHAKVEFVDSAIEELELQEKLKESKPALLLLPWTHYFGWKKIEPLFGLNRTSGPTVAGYLASPLSLAKLQDRFGDASPSMRGILLDFSHISSNEIGKLLHALSVDHLRCGLRPLVQAETPILFEKWERDQGPGKLLEAIFDIPQIANSDWTTRSNSIRICALALWSLVFEEGPGRTGRANAFFEIAPGLKTLGFRLCYTRNIWTPKEVLNRFWPSSSQVSSASKILSRFSDFLRVHIVPETNDVEVVVCLFQSQPSELNTLNVRSIWIDPVSVKSLNSVNEGEVPLSYPSQSVDPVETITETGPSVDTLAVIKKYQTKIAELESQIRELKSGGVGRKLPPQTPEPETLLEAFEERYFAAQLEIESLHRAVKKARTERSTPGELRVLRDRIKRLTNRERDWIEKISEIVQEIRSKKTRKTG